MLWSQTTKLVQQNCYIIVVLRDLRPQLRRNEKMRFPKRAQQSISRFAISMRLKLIFLAILLTHGVWAQDEGSGSGLIYYLKFEFSRAIFEVSIRVVFVGEAAAEEGSGGEAAAGGTEEGSGAEGSGAEGSGEEECEEGGSGDDIESLLSPSKCKKKDEMSGADALAAALGGGSCDTEGMDEKVWY